MTHKLALAFISDAISNSHAAIKACWLIVFSAGTFAALTSVDRVLIQMGWLVGTVSEQNKIAEHPVICFVMFGIFVVTFLRFYMGDVRIFDIRYTEIFRLVNLSIDQSNQPKDLNSFRLLVQNSDRNLYKFEVIVLTFQTLIIVFLAFQISSLSNFIRIYSFLMIWNAAYLIFNYYKSRAVVSPIFFEIFPFAKDLKSIASMFPMQASLIWFFNNLAAAILLLPGLLYQGDQMPGSLQVFLCLVMVANCLIDFYLARNFYFPRFTEFLDVAIPRAEPATEDLGLTSDTKVLAQ